MIGPATHTGRPSGASFLLSLRRRHQEAIAEHERARDLDPLSLIVNANLTRALYWVATGR